MVFYKIIINYVNLFMYYFLWKKIYMVVLKVIIVLKFEIKDDVYLR